MRCHYSLCFFWRTICSLKPLSLGVCGLWLSSLLIAAWILSKWTALPWCFPLGEIFWTFSCCCALLNTGTFTVSFSNSLSNDYRNWFPRNSFPWWCILWEYSSHFQSWCLWNQWSHFFCSVALTACAHLVMYCELQVHFICVEAIIQICLHSICVGCEEKNSDLRERELFYLTAVFLWITSSYLKRKKS